MTKQVGKDQNFMRNEWGTEFLSSEYGWESKIEKQKMLREIANDDLTPKKHDVDYDDWEYGTEPLYESKKPE